MAEHGEGSETKPEKNALLRFAHRLLKHQKDQPLRPSADLDAATTERINAIKAEIEKDLSRFDQLSLTAAGVGDTVWWKTASGSIGYLLIKEPYLDEGRGVEGRKTGRGEIMVIRAEGHPTGNQRTGGSIIGANLGPGLMPGKILKGRGLEYEFQIPEGGNMTYTTTPVVEMGLIRNLTSAT